MTNPACTFDTLQYVKQLREAGVPGKQAEVQAIAIKRLIDDKLATKVDMLRLEERIQHAEERLTNRINEMGYKIIISLGSIVVAGIVVLGVFVKLT